MASKELMGKINKLIDETFFVKDNREQDSVIKDIDFFKSRISHSRLINEIKKDINELYAIGKFDDLSNIRNILYLNLNIWILSYNIESTVLKDERKKMLDIKSHAIKTVLDIINSLLDLERYPVTLSNTSIKRLKEQHEDNKKEIINSIPNLFQFIEYLHSNINHFNDWAKWIPIFTGYQTEIDESDEEFYKSKVENHSSKLTIGKIRILTRIWLIIPFRNKVKNLDIADLDKKEYNWIHNKYNQAATALIYKVKEDKSYIREIHKIYGLYFGFKRKIDPRFIKLYPLLFASLDNVIKSIRSIRYFQADRLIPEVEFVEFERKEDKLKNSISEESQPMSIGTKSDDANVIVVETPNDSNTKITPQIKSLFSFIDFLHANIENFNQYDDVINNLYAAQKQYCALGTHFREIRKKKVLQKDIEAKWSVVFTNIVNPINDKVAELDLFDWSAPETLSNNHMPLVLRLSENCDDQDVDAILKAKNQYIEFTNKISPRVIKQAERMFEYLYEIMVEIAKNFHEEGDMRIKHQKKKQVGTFQELIEGFQAWENVSLPISLNNSVTANSKTVPKVPISNTAFNIDNNIDPINDNTMDINFEAIFEIALTYSDDSAEMREFCIREQKKADRDYFYKKSTFYKGLLKVVAKEKERAKPNPNPQPATMRIGTMFIAGTGGSPYKYSSIVLLEQIVNELLYQDKIPQEELDNIENRVENIETQPSHVSEIASYDSINEAMSIEITTSPPSFDIPLSNDELTEHFNELVKKPNSILHHNTDFHHFCYAFSGHIIPNDKLPYKAIELIDYNKSFYNYLNDEIVQAQLKSPQKCLPNQYRKKAQELFINKNGKPLKLSNPT